MADTKKVTVSKIVIELGKREITLSLEDAKQLQGVLNELLGQKVVEKTVEEHHHYWNKFLTTPYWYGNSGAYKYSDNVVYCSTSKPDAQLISNTDGADSFKVNG